MSIDIGGPRFVSNTCPRFYFRFGEGEGDEGDRPAAAAAAATAKASKPNVLESLGGEEGNINISNVTNVVVGRVGNLFGKGIGGLSTKFGGGSWF